MRYSSILYSWCAIITVVWSTDIQVHDSLLEARDWMNRSVYRRSPTDQPPDRGRSHSRSPTPSRGAGSPHKSKGNGQIKASRETPRTPSLGTPVPNSVPGSREATPQSQGTLPPNSRPGSREATPQSQGTPRPGGTPRAPHGGSATGDGRSRGPSPHGSQFGGQDQSASSRSSQYGGQSQSRGRGQTRYNLRSVRSPTPTMAAYDPHTGAYYEPFNHQYFPQRQPVLAHQDHMAGANFPPSSGIFIPPTRAETFASGPAKFYAHGGNQPPADHYLGANERGSKTASHARVSSGGGESVHGGRIFTTVSGLKVQGAVDPGPGGVGEFRYRTAEGRVARSSFAHPAKGQVRFSSQNGYPVTLQAESTGPADIFASARNSPPRSPPRSPEHSQMS